jgi:hypothetical protein
MLILLPLSEPAVDPRTFGSTYAAVLAVPSAYRHVLWAAGRDSLQRAAARDSARLIAARAAARLVDLAAAEAARRDSAASESAPAASVVPAVVPGLVPVVARRVAPTARILGRPVPGGLSPVRLELSLADLTLVALQGEDTLLVAAAGVGTGDTLRFGNRRWEFSTPPGRRVVRGKQADPVWVPPEWHYAALALERGYTLRHLRVGRAELEVVFGNTLYVPPLGTENRRVPGQLGAYRLDLGDGYLIHGTPDETTVGTPSSHGCVRLATDALAWVFAYVPVGAVVVIR